MKYGENGKHNEVMKIEQPFGEHLNPKNVSFGHCPNYSPPPILENYYSRYPDFKDWGGAPLAEQIC